MLTLFYLLESFPDIQTPQIQPSGRFVIGGPQGDAGLTGRKIIVDTYGGWGAHGGGAFSGKDFSKVDRSAAYTARWIGECWFLVYSAISDSMQFIAKSLVAAGLARRALVQLSYAIGVAEPLSIYVDTYGTSKKTDEELVEIVRKNWDLRPGVIGMQCQHTHSYLLILHLQSANLTSRNPNTSKPLRMDTSATLRTHGRRLNNSNFDFFIPARLDCFIFDWLSCCLLALHWKFILPPFILCTLLF